MLGARVPTEEEAEEEESGGQQGPRAEPARAAPGDRGPVAFVKGIPHLAGQGWGASWDLSLCCGPTEGQGLPPPGAARTFLPSAPESTLSPESSFSAPKLFLAHSPPIPERGRLVQSRGRGGAGGGGRVGPRPFGETL